MSDRGTRAARFEEARRNISLHAGELQAELDELERDPSVIAWPYEFTTYEFSSVPNGPITGKAEYLQCRAVTRKGSQCLNEMLHGGNETPEEVFAGYYCVHTGLIRPTVEQAKLLADGLCRLHREHPPARLVQVPKFALVVEGAPR
jgi:hypothetical protein